MKEPARKAKKRSCMWFTHIWINIFRLFVSFYTTTHKRTYYGRIWTHRMEMYGSERDSIWWWLWKQKSIRPNMHAYTSHIHRDTHTVALTSDSNSNSNNTYTIMPNKNRILSSLHLLKIYVCLSLYREAIFRAHTQYGECRSLWFCYCHYESSLLYFTSPHTRTHKQTQTLTNRVHMHASLTQRHHQNTQKNGHTHT